MCQRVSEVQGRCNTCRSRAKPRCKRRVGTTVSRFRASRGPQWSGPQMRFHEYRRFRARLPCRLASLRAGFSRCARHVTSMPRARGRATQNVRARLVRMHLRLARFLRLRAAAAGSHEPPPPSRFAPQAVRERQPAARLRRRLRSRFAANEILCTERSMCSSRIPSSSTTSSCSAQLRSTSFEHAVAGP